MSSGQVQHQNAFASAFLKANMISVFNTISEHSNKQTVIKTQSEFLTINALQNGILIKQKLGKRFTIGGQGNYRFGSGIYDYALVNGTNTINGQRSNIALEQKQLRGALRYDHNQLSVVLLGNYQSSNQNLPGAVVFYNPNSKETLSTNGNQGVIKIKYQTIKQSIAGHAFIQNSSTQYFQDFVLNNQGFIKNNYQQFQSGSGVIYHYHLGSFGQSIFIGSDFIQSELQGSQYTSVPIRQSMNSVVGITKWLGKFKIQGNLTHQKIKDLGIETEQNFSHLSPFLSIGITPFKSRDFRVRAFYKNAFRMPSFNDLYYRSIGNIDLQPENANLLNIGLTYQKKLKTLSVESTIDFYNNTVENKIVAIPTKNLFNWSIQNISKTLGRGVDLNVLLTQSFKDSKLVVSTNQSINRSIDVTDREGFTYGHQLPYTPVYFASYHLNFQNKFFSLALNLLHSGGRYVLTENITNNYLQGFVDIGTNVSHQFKFKKGQRLTAKVQANNMLNKNYQVVRSFPMPGRHYALTFQYLFEK